MMKIFFTKQKREQCYKVDWKPKISKFGIAPLSIILKPNNVIKLILKVSANKIIMSLIKTNLSDASDKTNGNYFFVSK